MWLKSAFFLWSRDDRTHRHIKKNVSRKVEWSERGDKAYQTSKWTHRHSSSSVCALSLSPPSLSLTYTHTHTEHLSQSQQAYEICLFIYIYAFPVYISSVIYLSIYLSISSLSIHLSLSLFLSLSLSIYIYIYIHTRMLRAILNKFSWQHPKRHQLYGHLPPITKTIQVRRTIHAGHCGRSRDEWCTPMDPHSWPSKSRTNSPNIYTAAMWGYGM